MKRTLLLCICLVATCWIDICSAANPLKVYGPEYTFGIYMQQLVQEPILIIKTAWGGKSLHTDLRPPTADPYEFNKQQLQNLTQQGEDIERVKAEHARATGLAYRLMIKHSKETARRC